MKIIFFSTPSELSDYSITDTNKIYPLGLAYLGAVLEKENFEVKVFDFFGLTWKEGAKKIFKIISSEKPDVIGLSSLTMNRTSASRVAKMAKKINPEIKVLMGGVHPSIMYEQILRTYPVDFIVFGEAEETILELMEGIKNGKKTSHFEKIKGIAFKNEGGQIVKTEPRGYIKNLNSLPYPKHKYFRREIENSKRVYMITSRGCPFGCLFCSTSNYWGRMCRRRSVENIMGEIKFLIKEFPSIEELFFVDDEFTLNQEHAIELCKAMVKEGVKLKWDCSTRVSSVSEELVYWMKKAGCVHVSMGVESGSKKLIETIHKRITIEQVISSFELFHKYKIPASMYLITGIPGEDSHTVNETIKLLKILAKAKPEFKKPALLQIYPNTEVYDLAKKQGIIDDNYWLTTKLVPHYTYEHSKNKLLYWSMKIAFYNKYYQGELFKFLLRIISKPLKSLKLMRLGK
jgi:radical SAM superfamily enzyme YgiQ (UPF0313 family)